VCSSDLLKTGPARPSFTGLVSLQPTAVDRIQIGCWYP